MTPAVGRRLAVRRATQHHSTARYGLIALGALLVAFSLIELFQLPRPPKAHTRATRHASSAVTQKPVTAAPT
jgi:hypothetical protein